MIVGGAFRGLSRAIGQSLSFIWSYTLAGVPLSFVIGVFASRSVGPGPLVLLHIFMILVVLPAAIVGNLLALRVLGWRSWRGEKWRARVAGFAAAALVWVGFFVAGGQSAVPEPLLATLGGLAIPIFFLAVAVTCSNLALLVAWLLPPRKRWTPRSRGEGGAAAGC